MERSRNGHETGEAREVRYSKGETYSLAEMVKRSIQKGDTGREFSSS